MIERTCTRFPQWPLLLSSTLLDAPAVASAQELFEIPAIQGDVQLDGHGAEAVWTLIAPLPLTVYQPTYGVDPSERTEIRLAHDGVRIDEAISNDAEAGTATGPFNLNWNAPWDAVTRRTDEGWEAESSSSAYRAATPFT